MKIGIICPVAHLEDFAIKSDFHLILPHLFKEFPAYREFYRYRAQQGDFVLQDNSVFELGHSLSADMLIEEANLIGASEMSACEVLSNSLESYKAAIHTVERSVKLGNKIPLLAVVQGESLSSFINYFFSLNSISEISSLGLPFDLDYLEGENHLFTDYDSLKSRTLRRVLNRWRLVEILDEEAKKRNVTIKSTHLMGLSDGMELQKYKNYYWIRSNDSSSAYVHGAAGFRYTDRGLPCEKISRKLDFSSSLTNDEQIDDVLYNIDKLKEFSK